MINSSIRQGKWPNLFKLETVTPVPKVYPPKNVEELRNISGLLNLDKVFRKRNFQVDNIRYEEEHGSFPICLAEGAVYSALLGQDVG